MTVTTVSPFSTRELRTDADGSHRFANLSPTIPALLRRAVDTAPLRMALVDAQTCCTYFELWDTASRVAGGLRWDGCQPGDRVVICMENSATWIQAYFGVLLAGAIAVPMNPSLTRSEKEYIVEDCSARHVLASPSEIPYGPLLFDRDTNSDDVATICYTSGTTGKPKGATLTHANHLSAVEGFCRALESNDGFYDGVRTLIVAPLFHAAGLVIQMLTTVRMAGTSMVHGRFDAGSFLRSISEQRVESIFGVPAMLHSVLNHPDFPDTDLSSVRNVLYGAAPVSPGLIERLLSAFPHAKLGNGYGMTEMSPATFLPHRDAARYPNSVGFPTPGTEVRLENVDSCGVGELVVRGPQVMSRYWSSPHASVVSLDRGWMHTGDLCRIDCDGRVFVVDRSKDMIIRGGENVYCVEVEDALATNESVVEAAVIGLPDERLGERVAALVVIRPDSQLTSDELVGHLTKVLARYKIPEFVVLRTEPLPRNAGGKVIKSEVREAPCWAAATPLRFPTVIPRKEPS